MVAETAYHPRRNIAQGRRYATPSLTSCGRCARHPAAYKAETDAAEASIIGEFPKRAAERLAIQ